MSQDQMVLHLGVASKGTVLCGAPSTDGTYMFNPEWVTCKTCLKLTRKGRAR